MAVMGQKNGAGGGEGEEEGETSAGPLLKYEIYEPQ